LKFMFHLLLKNQHHHNNKEKKIENYHQLFSYYYC
jgi:hypothetical protein